MSRDTSMLAARWRSTAVLAGTLLAGTAQATTITYFTPGDLVVSVEGNGLQTPGVTYTDNQAAPLSLYEFKTTGTGQTPVGTLVLPQASSGNNFAVSGEYGSSSEGTLQLTGNGHDLTIMGYGVNASTFNSGGAAVYGDAALGQSCSLSVVAACPILTSKAQQTVPRVVAVIGPNGAVDSTTALYNVFDENNPRSVYSVDGKTFYISGQGNSPDQTGGVFYTTLGSHSATPITGDDTSGMTLTQDTREVQVYDNTLYVSVDSKEGSNAARSFVGTLGPIGGPLPTGVANGQNGPTMLNGFGTNSGNGKVTISNGANSNGNGLNAGLQINLSPENYFFANSTTLYVADSGNSKQTSANSKVGDGGLQKWTLSDGTWSLDYTLADGLNLVLNSAISGSTGLYGLTGEDVTIDGIQEVELFATNATIGDLDQTYLFGITDILADTMSSQVADESFTELAVAPADTNFKGVSFAPVPEPSSLAALMAGLLSLGLLRRRRRS